MHRLALLATFFLLFARTSPAIDLKPETIEAFDKFIAGAEARLEPRFSGRNFLWSDEVPGVRKNF